MRIKFVSLAECHAGCLKVLVAHSHCTQGSNMRGLMTQDKGEGGAGKVVDRVEEQRSECLTAKLAD